MHVIGWCEEAGVPGENPRIHGENMQIAHRKNQLGFEPRTLLLCGDGANHHFTMQSLVKFKSYGEEIKYLLMVKT